MPGVVGDMIETLPTLPGAGAQLRLRPPRALSGRQFIGLFLALAAAMWLVALLGWWAGNVFAPWFALLDSALVAAALAWLWRLGSRDERITIRADAIEVWRWGATAPAFRAHPYWVRLEAGTGAGGGDADDAAVVLACSGRRCEIGAFLAPAERRQLAERLRELLAAHGTARQ